ncbi:MAG: energy-coupling factor ABC transporter permease [Methyloligellaceae bacterium]
MHIEPGIVDGAKIALSYTTALGAGAYAIKLAIDAFAKKGFAPLLIGTAICTLLVFCFFEVLPHYPIGVSEVHFILGATLFLIFGAAPAAFGLALGLLLQGSLFAPADLPQYGINVTTLLVPLFLVNSIASRYIDTNTAYVDLRYRDTLALSAAYQGGVIAWVAFWAFYGSGLTVETWNAVSVFGAAYMVVILVEPVADIAILAAAKSLKQFKETSVFEPRLYNAG